MSQRTMRIVAWAAIIGLIIGSGTGIASIVF